MNTIRSFLTVVCISVGIIVGVVGCQRTTYPLAETQPSAEENVKYDFKLDPQKPVGFPAAPSK